MLACARLGAVHSVVFGGFAPHELAVRIDDARPKVVLSASCGIEGRRVIAYKPLLDRALELAEHRARALRDPAARRRPRRRCCRPGRDLDWDELIGRRRARRPACRSPPPTRSTSSTRRARPASRRASCATTAATRSRCAWSMAERLRHRPRRGVLGGLRRRLGRRPLLHRLRAAARRLHDRPLRGQAGRHARPGRVLARDRPARRARRCSPRRPRSARSARRTPRRAPRPATTSAASRRCSSPASGSTPTPTTGPRDLLGRARDRPLVADRDRLADRGQLPRASSRCPVKPGSPTQAGARATTSRVARRRPASESRPASEGAIADRAAAAAGHAADALERRRALRALVPRRASRATTSTGDGGTRRGRLPVRHGPHRRRHQRRRPPPLDRRDGGGRRDPPRRRRVRRDRRRRRAQGPGAARARRAQGGRRRATRTSCEAELVALVRERDRRRSPASSDALRRRAPAEDPLGQDPARDDARHRRRAASTRVPSTIDDPAILDEIAAALDGRAG